jgi:aminoglycoside phosphotransferase (APT) family kinase protein
MELRRRGHRIGQGRSELIARVAADAVDDAWDDVYRAAIADGGSIAGFYHNNIRVGQHLVRTAIPDADRMDLHIWSEPDVLAIVGRYLDCVPELRSVSHEPAYQIHEWVDGVVLNDVSPKGTQVPAGTIDQFTGFFAALGRIPTEDMPTVPVGWPVDGDSAGFASRLSDITRTVHTSFAEEYASLWWALGIPDDPFESLSLHGLTPRPFRMVHSDVHRQNVLIKPDGRLTFLDWELALMGDPVYELAVHLHKMAYLPDEDQRMRTVWATACGADQWPNWSEDLERYLSHERVKSVIVDSVRYSKAVAEDPTQLEPRVESLARKLTLARAVWRDPRPVDRAELAALLTGRAR